MRCLEIHAGASARARLLEEGLRPEQFDVLVGASGGAKWLVLCALDQQLFPWLLQRSSPLRCVGSSIGSWRHLCLAQVDPAAATRRLCESYIDQRYSSRPDAHEISAVSAQILRALLGENGNKAVLEHPVLQTHILAVRGRGPWRSQQRGALLAASAATFGANLARRTWLDHLLERNCFHSGARATALEFGSLSTRYAALAPQNLAAVALASGSIPLLARGVSEIEAGEIFWDGGVSDYHVQPDFPNATGLVLYPHFYPYLLPGWFDKTLRWRRQQVERWPNLVLLCPSAAFVASLPRGRIPDRRDFHRLPGAERERVWRGVAEQGERLAEEFVRLCSGQDIAAAMPALACTRGL